VGTLAEGKRPGLLDVTPAGSSSDGSGDDPERLLVADSNPRIRWMAHA